MIRHLLIISTSFLLLMPISLQAMVYQWTDEQGNVGFTDDPDSIPEKYRQNAERLDSGTPQKPKINTPSASPPATNRSENRPAVDDEGRDEQWWKTRMQDLRDRKQTLLEEKERLEAGTNALGKLGLGNIEENQDAKETLDRIQELDREIVRIETELTIVAPEEARKANAPPGWLRE